MFFPLVLCERFSRSARENTQTEISAPFLRRREKFRHVVARVSLDFGVDTHTRRIYDLQNL